MIRKIFFWLYLSNGVAAGSFLFVMAATGVALSLEKPAIEFLDRDIRSVSAPGEAQPRPLNDLLANVRRAGLGSPSSVVVRNRSQAAPEFMLDRGRGCMWISTAAPRWG